MGINKKVMRIMPVFLAFILLFTSVVPIQASVSNGDNAEISVNEGNILFETDFETANPFGTGNTAGGSAAVTTDSTEHGNVLEYTRTAEGEIFMYLQPAAPTANTSVVYEFDMKLLGVNANNSLGIRGATDSGNAWAWPVKIENGVLVDGSGNSLETLQAGTWYTVSLVYNYIAGESSVYLNGVQLGSTLATQMPFTANNVNQLRFVSNGVTFFDNKSADFMMDNVKIYEGTKPVTEEEDDAGMDGIPEVTVNEGKIILETDFESSHPFSFNNNENGKMELVQDNSGHGKVIEFTKTAAAESFMYVNPGVSVTEGMSVVYEFDLKLLGANTSASLGIKASGGKWSWPLHLNAGQLSSEGQGNKTLETGKWYTVSLVYDYNTGKRNVYLDGALFVENITNDTEFMAASTVEQLRFISIAVSDYEDKAADFRVDNVKVYEGTAPLQEGTMFFETNLEESNPFGWGTTDGGPMVWTEDAEGHGNAVRFTKSGTGEFFMHVNSGAAETANTSVVYEYDVKLLGETASNSLGIRGTTDNGNAFAWPLKIVSSVLTDGKGNSLKTLETEKWYTISLIIDYNANESSVYLDGVQLGDSIVTEMPFTADQVNQLRFISTSVDSYENNAADFMVDNVKVYEGTKPIESEDDNIGEGGGEEETPEVSITEGYKIFEADFEESNPFKFVPQQGGTIVQATAEEEHGNVIEFTRTGTGDFYMYASPVSADTANTSVVYEFDVKLFDAEASSMLIMLRADGPKFAYPVYISNGVIKGRNNYTQTDGLATLEAEQWYTISVVCDYAARVRSIYLDGEKLAENLPMEEDFVDADKANQIRIYSGSVETLDGNESHFIVDNIRVYEGTKPLEGELVVEDVIITINPDKSIFNEEKYNTDKYDTMLNGYVALHTRSGMVYKDAESKTKLATAPVESENGCSVVLLEICEALGLTYQVSDNQAIVNGNSVNVWEDGGKQWVDAEQLLTTYGNVSVDTNGTVKSSGMLIAGNTAFCWPSAEYDASDVFHGRSELQKLNDYLFFERPTTEQITEAYEESDLNGVHPRIQATADDFARIKEDVQTDPLMKTWYQQLLSAADYLVEVDRDPVIWELPDGIRLLDVSQDVTNKMYTLGMAYQLTGEQKYVDRAWLDMQAVSNFKDWNPVHDLDPAVMSAGMAIGYDWMYHGLTEEQRKTIEEGIYKNLFAVVCESYESSYGILGTNPVCLINHNIVLNGGFTMSALALMDVYPEISAHITSMCIRGADLMLIEYGKDGAWKEGPGYWEFTTRYTTKMLSALETVFGTCFGLDLCEGLEETADFVLNLQSDVGCFNYGDTDLGTTYSPIMYYLSDKYSNPDVTATVLALSEGKVSGNENLVHSLLWYDTDIKAGAVEMELDAAYEDEGVITMRDQWTKGVTTFVGIHGGANQVCHAQVDAGTFVYDYAGIRWAKELGKTPYDTTVTSEYEADGGRWLLYRSLAESHNLIVINPDNTPGQKVDAVATVELVESKDKGSIAVVDLTENYSANASSVIRGFFFTDDRTSLVVRDEISLIEDDATIYWFIQTDADVEIAADGKSATLTQLGKQVMLEFVTSGSGVAELSVGPSTRELLGSTSPIHASVVADTNKYDVEDENVNRIAIKLTHAGGDVTITAKLTPLGVSSTPVSDYDKSISEWTVPEGEVAEKPQLQCVVMDGRTVKFDETNQATYLCVEGRDTTVPEAVVMVDETKYIYEVQNAETTDGGTTTIVVKEKENADVYTTYTVHFEEIPVPMSFEGMTSLQVIAAEASEEPEGTSNGYVAWKTIDNDLNSRWTSQGMGQWILLELEKESVVDNMMILFKNGHLRSTYFSVEVSVDGENFETVFDGQSAGTAIGDAEAFEQIALGGVNAKYIRINCNGNSVQGMVAGWNNIGEIVFTGNVTESDEEPDSTPSTDPTPSPETNNGSSSAANSNEAQNTAASGENAAVKVGMAVVTGDDSNVTLYCVLLVLACAGLVAGIVYCRKNA